MPQNLEIAGLLPQIAALRRGAVYARRLAREAGDPTTKTRLNNEAEDLDRQADEIEVRLSILKEALKAWDPEQQIAVFQI